jgi:heme/copper-type cytochrome/quinol oxidase subunit 4
MTYRNADKSSLFSLLDSLFKNNRKDKFIVLIALIQILILFLYFPHNHTTRAKISRQKHGFFELSTNQRPCF